MSASTSTIEIGPGCIPPEILQFRWDLNAGCNLEAALGKAIFDDGVLQIDLASPKDIRVLIFAGLKSNVPGITAEDVGRLITPENSQAVYALIFARLSKASADAALMAIQGGQ